MDSGYFKPVSGALSVVDRVANYLRDDTGAFGRYFLGHGDDAQGNDIIEDHENQIQNADGKE